MAEKSRFRSIAQFLVVGFACMVLVVYLAHWVWGYVAARELNRQIAAIQQSGEPVFPIDFLPLTPDGPDNAVSALQAASESLNEMTPAWNLATADIGLPLRDAERKAIEEIVGQDESRIRQTLQALALPRAEWYLDPRRAAVVDMLPNLNGMRGLTHLLGASALLEHDRGNDAVAVDRFIQMMRLGNVTGKHPSVVGHLVSLGCTALTSNRVMMVTADLKIGDGGASPMEVNRLIALLMDDSATTESLRSAWLGERMFELAMINSVLQKPADVSQYAWNQRSAIIRPFFDMNASVLLDHMTSMLATPPSPDLPTAKAAMPKIPSGVERHSFRYMMASILMPSLNGVVDSHYRNRTDRRLAATGLAIRWYATEHGGKLPETLQELVPRYLPAVPTDPLIAGGKPLGYKPADVTPMIYSVGQNGIDDGGSDQPVRVRSSYVDEWGLRDRIDYLTRQPRKPPEEESPGTGN